MKSWKNTALVFVMVLAQGVLMVRSPRAQFGESIQWFPHYGAGPGIETFFSIHNPGAGAITVRLELFRSEGTLFRFQEVGVAAEGTTSVRISGQGDEIAVGWARLSSEDGKFTASELFQIRDSQGNLLTQVGVLPAPRTDRFRAFVTLKGSDRTGLALAHPGDSDPAALQVRLLEPGGGQVDQAQFTLEPARQLARFLDEAPFFPGLQEFEGLVEVTSDEPVIAVTLRQTGIVLGSSPILTPQPALGAGSVGTEHLADEAVTSEKMAPGAVGSPQLAEMVSFGGSGVNKRKISPPDWLRNRKKPLSRNTNGGGFAALFDDLGNEAIRGSTFAPDGNGDRSGSLRIFNSLGNELFRVTRTTSGSGFVAVSDRQGNDLLHLTRTSSGAGNLDLFNEAGGELATLSMTTTGAGFIAANSADGQRTVQITSRENGQSGSLTVYDSNDNPVAGIRGDSGDVWGVTKSFLVPDPENAERFIRYTAVEGPEAAIYCRGTAQLQLGQAWVPFPNHFAALAAAGSVSVTLTPRSVASRGLAVVQVDADSFLVGELAGGSGSYPFDYVVCALRKGFEERPVYVPSPELKALEEAPGRGAQEPLEAGEEEGAPLESRWAHQCLAKERREAQWPRAWCGGWPAVIFSANPGL